VKANPKMLPFLLHTFLPYENSAFKLKFIQYLINTLKTNICSTSTFWFIHYFLYLLILHGLFLVSECFVHCALCRDGKLLNFTNPLDYLRILPTNQPTRHYITFFPASFDS